MISARPAKTTSPHPTPRLALATVLLGLLAFVSHFALVYMFMAGSVLQKLSEQYKQIVDDPAYIRWDFDRQPVVSIPLLDDEVFAGSPTADNTVIVYSDFQCSQCRRAHAAIDELLTRYPERLRVVYRFFPQDPECNPHPNFQAGGHEITAPGVRTHEQGKRGRCRQLPLEVSSGHGQFVQVGEKGAGKFWPVHRTVAP